MTSTSSGSPALVPPPVREESAGRIRCLWLLARPNQWLKNALVLSAPAAAGVLAEPRAVLRVGAATAAFVLASAATYAFNDVWDRDADRRHPDKHRRPVASGAVAVRQALTAAAIWASTALAIAWLVAPTVCALVGAYLAVCAAYTLRLKHVAVLDIVCVAAGFVLRAIAGAAAVPVQVSSWFLLVSLFGALFLVVAKRRSELMRVGASAHTRPTLGGYSPDWLAQVLTMSLTGTVLSYCTWAFQVHGERSLRPVLAASVVPFLVALLRYLLVVDKGDGERPETILMRDKTLLGCAVTWCALVAWALYLT